MEPKNNQMTAPQPSEFSGCFYSIRTRPPHLQLFVQPFLGGICESLLVVLVVVKKEGSGYPYEHTQVPHPHHYTE